MKLVKYLLVVMFLVFAGCSSNISDDKEMTVTFLTDINCEKCEAKLFKNIPHEEGIVKMKVDVPEKLVTITFNKSETTIEKIIKILGDLGYKASVKN